MKAILYMHQTCSLCNDAKDLLTVLQEIYDFSIEERDIKTNDIWHEKYVFTVPVVDIAGKEFMHPNLTFEALSAHIEAQEKQ